MNECIMLYVVVLIAVRDSIIIGVAASCVFLLAVAFVGSLIYRPVTVIGSDAVRSV